MNKNTVRKRIWIRNWNRNINRNVTWSRNRAGTAQG